MNTGGQYDRIRKDTVSTELELSVPSSAEPVDIIIIHKGMQVCFPECKCRGTAGQDVGMLVQNVPKSCRTNDMMLSGKCSHRTM